MRPAECSTGKQGRSAGGGAKVAQSSVCLSTNDDAKCAARRDATPEDSSREDRLMLFANNGDDTLTQSLGLHSCSGCNFCLQNYTHIPSYLVCMVNTRNIAI